MTCAIWTSGTVHRTTEVKELLDPIFDYDFSVSEIGLAKTDSRVYKLLAQKLKVKPEQIIYIDDNLMNLEAAREAGVKAIQYMNNKQIISEIEKLF